MLELQNIVFSAAQEDTGAVKDILQDVSLTLDEGKLFVVTGPNGSGKSTLAKIIMGILTPDSGRIILNGEDITHLSVTERARRGISFAFQQPVRFKGLCVIDLLRIAAAKELTISQACTYLSAVGLCARDYINREVNASLSGGELKRIEIAMVLARGTSLSVFDEPEAGIDLWSFQNLTGVFTKMREQKDRSMLIISHQERILDIADEIIVLSGGKITKRGSKEEILPTLLGTAAAVNMCTGNTAPEASLQAALSKEV